ncbi:DUF262 domain-containing protein [Dolichospermum circinale]|uniref:DUF262 domain-containing protein n=1 Tax=Dolichospermum circinale TaxID=109265 RepID=UPI003A959242
MELHAYTRTISDLFSVKKKYVVPRFQREYSWTKEKVSELWEDILSNITINNDKQQMKLILIRKVFVNCYLN